jgi:hypothetical protein
VYALMRDDVLVFDAGDAAWLLALIERFEQLSARMGVPLPRSAPEVKRYVASYLSRVSGGVNVTTRPPIGRIEHTEVDTGSAAALLGITPAAVRKRCETGIYRGVAQKRHGRWWIPVEDIEAELEAEGVA